MARNSEIQITILRYFAIMYEKRYALVYHRQDNDFNVFCSTDLNISKDLNPYYRPVDLSSKLFHSYLVLCLLYTVHF